MKNRLIIKLFALTLALTFILSLTACGNETHTHSGDSSSNDMHSSSLMPSIDNSSQQNGNNSSQQNSNNATQPNTNAKISESEAKATALKDANAKEDDISHYKSELEQDAGVWEYEISFKVGNVEYDYSIDANTGKIINSDKDIND